MSKNKPELKPIIIKEKCIEIEESWSPIDLACVNDQVVRMALFHGKYQWHKHMNEDELFYVYKGRVVIKMKEYKDVELYEGELVVVPKNVEHCPESSEPSYVLMFEPYELKSKGD